MSSRKPRERPDPCSTSPRSGPAAAERERPDFLQFNYSLGSRGAERRLLPFAREKGIAELVNRPFAEGAWFAKVRDRALPPWARKAGWSAWSRSFLDYALSHPAVTCIIPASSNPAHMRENLESLSGDLPDEAMRLRMARCFDEL